MVRVPLERRRQDGDTDEQRARQGCVHHRRSARRRRRDGHSARRAGAKVALVDLEADPLREIVERLGSASATSVIGDVTDLADMQAAVAHGVERFGGIDVVVANAGIASYGSVARSTQRSSGVSSTST